MNMLRMLLPYIMGCFGILIFLWFIGWRVILKNSKDSLDKEEYYKLEKIVKMVYFTIVPLLFMMLFIKAVNMASVNEVPRSVIDRTTPDQMKENFEERMKANAERAKITNDSIKQLNK